jgi:hypothetical protein
MDRIIIKLHSSLDGPNQFYLDESPWNVQGADKLCPLTASIDVPPFSVFRSGVCQPDVVKLVGEQLYGALTRHAGVQDAFHNAFQVPSGTSCPVYIQIQADSDVEELAWETLRPENRAPLALTENLPVARITVGERTTRTDQTFVSPLRMMALLAAQGVPADKEWNSLETALRFTTLQVKLRVLCCDEDLLARIKGALAADPLPNGSTVDAAFVPGIVEDLLKDIGRFAPNVLHFFCHGSTQNGPHLQIATRADWILGDRSSVVLDTSALSMIRGFDTYNWLVTLNCCLGAAPIERAHSLSRSLVSQGFPAVIGMREPIDIGDASDFTKALYTEFFVEVEGATNPPAQTIEVCWPKVLASARRTLLQKHTNGAPPPVAPNEVKEWTLPVLYVQRPPFVLRPTSNQSLATGVALETQAQLKTLLEVRDRLRGIPNLPPGVVTEIDDKIAEILHQLHM